MPVARSSAAAAAEGGRRGGGARLGDGKAVGLDERAGVRRDGVELILERGYGGLRHATSIFADPDYKMRSAKEIPFAACPNDEVLDARLAVDYCLSISISMVNCTSLPRAGGEYLGPKLKSVRWMVPVAEKPLTVLPWGPG